ncbi:MAG: RNA 2',3'-cyclic phosphodiesterase [Candidatus Aminicenantes bacterium]|nr:RNA 2',3'-cyclic phosphodiesterase [Candidatus Aminicenantes bacterium]
MRTFIAIDLDKKIKEDLTRLIDTIDKEKKSVKWVNLSGMHLTLKFLGEISMEKSQEVESLMNDIIKSHSSFPMRIIGTGTFPKNSKYPRVLWVGIEESQQLSNLHLHIENELERRIHFPKENRRFHPHLTLGRVKSNFRLNSILTELNKHKNRIFGEMQVETITFFKSTLKPTGAEYEALKEFHLK